jgi:hypothetical protein
MHLSFHRIEEPSHRRKIHSQFICQPWELGRSLSSYSLCLGSWTTAKINPWLDLSIDWRVVLELMLSVRIQARRGGILRFEAQSRAGMCAGLLRTMVDSGFLGQTDDDFITYHHYRS